MDLDKKKIKNVRCIWVLVSNYLMQILDLVIFFFTYTYIYIWGTLFTEQLER